MVKGFKSTKVLTALGLVLVLLMSTLIGNRVLKIGSEMPENAPGSAKEICVSYDDGTSSTLWVDFCVAKSASAQTPRDYTITFSYWSNPGEENALREGGHIWLDFHDMPLGIFSVADNEHIVSAKPEKCSDDTDVSNYNIPITFGLIENSVEYGVQGTLTLTYTVSYSAECGEYNAEFQICDETFDYYCLSISQYITSSDYDNWFYTTATNYVAVDGDKLEFINDTERTAEDLIALHNNSLSNHGSITENVDKKPYAVMYTVALNTGRGPYYNQWNACAENAITSINLRDVLPEGMTVMTNEEIDELIAEFPECESSLRYPHLVLGSREESEENYKWEFAYRSDGLIEIDSDGGAISANIPSGVSTSPDYCTAVTATPSGSDRVFNGNGPVNLIFWAKVTNPSDSVHSYKSEISAEVEMESGTATPTFTHTLKYFCEDQPELIYELVGTSIDTLAEHDELNPLLLPELSNRDVYYRMVYIVSESDLEAGALTLTNHLGKNIVNPVFIADASTEYIDFKYDRKTNTVTVTNTDKIEAGNEVWVTFKAAAYVSAGDVQANQFFAGETGSNTACVREPAWVKLSKYDSDMAPLTIPGVFELVKVERTGSTINYVRYSPPKTFTISSETDDLPEEYELLRLHPGEYAIKEVTPPLGYRLPSDYEYIHFTVNEDLTTEPGDLYKNGKIVANPNGKHLYFTHCAGYNKHFLQICVKNDKVTEGKNVNIKKVCSKNSNNLLTGAVFMVEKVSGATRTLIATLTSNAGYTETVTLEPSDYEITETTAPNGFVRVFSVIKITVNADLSVTVNTDGVTTEFNGDTVSIVIKNDPASVTTKAKIKKVDADDPEKFLSSAEFIIEKFDTALNDWSLQVTRLVTDSNGDSETETLTPGRYRLTETTAPAGYDRLMEPFEFTVSSTGVLTATTNNGVTLTLKDGVYTFTVPNREILDNASLRIHKVCSVGREGLENAVFKLEKLNGTQYTEVATLLSESDGDTNIVDLIPGHYKLTETTAPAAHKRIVNPIEFDVSESYVLTGTFPLGVTLAHTGNLYTLTIPNAPSDSADINIVKISSLSKETKLPQAVFLLEKQGISGYTTSGTLTTSTDGVSNTLSLTPGDYRLTETSAPVGYNVYPDPITFAVNSDFQVIAGSFEGVDYSYDDGVFSFIIEDTPSEGAKLFIKKISALSNDILLEDASFELSKLTSGNYVPFTTLTTGTGGVTQTVTLTEGSYRLTETAAPTGYTGFTGNIDFVVNADLTITGAMPSGILLNIVDGVYSITVPNTLTTGADVNIKKISSIDSNTVLPNAKFVIEEQTSSGWVTRATLTSDSTGMTNAVTLVPGEYRLRETVAPAGYSRIITAISFTVNADYSITVGALPSGVAFGKVGGIYRFTVPNAPKEDADLQIMKVSSANRNRVLSGANFRIDRLVNTAWQTYALLSTDADGLTAVVSLVPGSYRLIETKAPTNYRRLISTIAFTVTSDYEIVMSLPSSISRSDVDGLTTLTIKNAPNNPPTPTPTPRTRVTPTPTPRVTPTPTPRTTPSVTPTPSTTPTPSVTPTPSTTPTPSVTPTPTEPDFTMTPPPNPEGSVSPSPEVTVIYPTPTPSDDEIIPLDPTEPAGKPNPITLDARSQLSMSYVSVVMAGTLLFFLLKKRK